MQEMSRLNFLFLAQLLSKAGRGGRPCCCVCHRGHPVAVEVGAEVGGGVGRRALIGHGGAGRQASGAEDGAGTSR
jgi:hypothetical protein